MKSVLIVAAALALSGCTANYAYDYDPYAGPRGHYVSAFHHPAQSAAVPCARTVYLGPYDGGVRGPYYAGPYCVGPDGRAMAPVTEVAAVPAR
jgi:hypothetical protein